jgi:P-type E1-E2 ATPase
LICDINGTLAVDGRLIDGVAPLIEEIKRSLEVYLLSADTMGSAAEIAQTLGVKLQRLHPGNEKQQKADFVKEHNSNGCITIGQGANDEWMLRDAALGICVLSPEGTAVKTLQSADIVVPDILQL